jgi:hypothetical protein
MDFRPRISPELKIMDAEMFLPEWGRLKGILDERTSMHPFENNEEIEDELVAS